MTKKSMTTGEPTGKPEITEGGHPPSDRWEALLAEANFLRFEAGRMGSHTLAAAADLKMRTLWDAAEADELRTTPAPASRHSALIQTLVALRAIEGRGKS